MADEGQSGGIQIARLNKGDKLRTAQHAAVMNEIIDAVNALRSAEVTVKDDLPSDAKPTGTFHQADANSHLEIRIRKGAITVTDDDGHEVKNVTNIEFVGYNAVVVSDGHNGKAIVKVFPDPPGSGTYVLASVDGNVDWIPCST